VSKQLLFSVTRKDFRVDYYKGSGKGGQKRNKTENCCRITHLESGAVGKSEEGRSKEHNKKKAFERCVNSEIFQKWFKVETARRLGRLVDVEEAVEKAMHPSNIKVETKNELGQWEVKEE
jgi:protein subunit release factor A